MRISTTLAMLAIGVGGLSLAGCGNSRPEKARENTRDKSKTEVAQDKSGSGKSAEATDNKSPTDSSAAKSVAANAGAPGDSGKPSATAEKSTDAAKTVATAKATAKTGDTKTAESTKSSTQAETVAAKSGTVAKTPSTAASSETAPPGDSLESKVFLPTGVKGSSVLEVVSTTPRRVQIDRSYQYTITITNISTDIPLANVRVSHGIRQKMTLEAATLQVGTSEGKTALSTGGALGPPAWTIARLNPGQVATIVVQAKGQESGQNGNDLSVQYDPFLILKPDVAKPAIQLAKSGPPGDAVENRQIIEYTYTLTNDTDKEVKDVTVTDMLAEGLTTHKEQSDKRITPGQNVVRFKCDKIPPKGSATCKVNLLAAKPGRYSSAAYFSWPESQSVMKRWESIPLATHVRWGKLKLNVEPVAMQFTGQKVIYKVTVTNDGDAAVAAPQLQVKLGEGAEPADERVEKLFVRKDRLATLPLAALKPKETSPPILVTMRMLNKPGELKNEFAALFNCDGQPTMLEQIKDSKPVTTQIRKLDLVLTLTPNRRVEPGALFTCEAIVKNIGESAARNLTVSVKLPPLVAFAGIEDGVRAQFDKESNTVKFEPLAEMRADSVPHSFGFRVRAEKEGTGQIIASLKGDPLGSGNVVIAECDLEVAAKKGEATSSSPSDKGTTAKQPAPAKTSDSPKSAGAKTDSPKAAEAAKPKG